MSRPEVHVTHLRHYKYFTICSHFVLSQSIQSVIAFISSIQNCIDPSNARQITFQTHVSCSADLVKTWPLFN